jgi:hypothetical protein
MVPVRAYGTFSLHRHADSKEHAQRDMQHDALQELETPAVVRLTRHEPLLYDAQHRPVPVRLDHRRGVACEEGTQQRDESWDGALSSPHSWCEEREEISVVDWHALGQRQHLGDDLEDVEYVFCDSQYPAVA